MTNSSNGELTHYGILGMRWGRRKRQDGRGYEPSGKLPRGRRSAESAAVANLRRNPVSTLTNAELRMINERMNLEQNYRNLQSNASIVGRGRQHISKFLGDAGNLERVLKIPESKAWGYGVSIIDKARK